MGDSGAIRLTFRRTGGLFAGNVLETSLGAEELAAPEAAELRELLAGADLAQHARRSPIRGTGADLYQYELDVEGEGARWHVIVAHGAIPDDLRPLIVALERRADDERTRTTE